MIFLGLVTHKYPRDIGLKKGISHRGCVGFGHVFFGQAVFKSEIEDCLKEGIHLGEAIQSLGAEKRAKVGGG